MSQLRLVIVAGAGVLVLCAVALAGSLLDYVSHPEVANVHVAPAVATPVTGPAAQPAAAAPPPPAPIATAPPPASPPAAQPRPAATAPTAQAGDLARFLQQVRDRHRRVPRGG
jgi:hypothetical protein